MSREEAYEQAAACYRRAGEDMEAARCYRLAGAHRRAAEIYASTGHYQQAAESFADAGLPELGAWLLAHHANQPARARALLGAASQEDDRSQRPTEPPTATRTQRGDQRLEPPPSVLRRQLILARCEIAEGAPADVIRPVIADVCAALADQSARSDQVTEEWAVALSEAASRYDQAALVFAAAVRGGRYGAAQRWQAWSVRILGTEIILPPTTAGTTAAATAVA